MNAFFVDLFGPMLGVWVSAIVAIILVLVVLWIAWAIVKRMRGGLFISGGRHRTPRLAVLDAVPIDSRRRLVLVRRDQTEHVILIGGPNDLVVEQGRAITGQTDSSAAGANARDEIADLARQAAHEAQSGRTVRRDAEYNEAVERPAARSGTVAAAAGAVTIGAAVNQAVSAPEASVAPEDNAFEIAPPEAVVHASSTADLSPPEPVSPTPEWDAAPPVEWEPKPAADRDAALERLQAAARRHQTRTAREEPVSDNAGPDASSRSEPSIDAAISDSFDEIDFSVEDVESGSATADHPAEAGAPTLDDEMERLLADLEANRR